MKYKKNSTTVNSLNVPEVKTVANEMKGIRRSVHSSVRQSQQELGSRLSGGQEIVERANSGGDYLEYDEDDEYE